MITIGIRATPRVITFAVYDSDANAVVNVEEIEIPAAFSKPEGLKFARSNLLDVLRETQLSARASGSRSRMPIPISTVFS